MLRISKLTDYGVVLTTRLAVSPEGETLAAADLCRETGIPQPTASKVLKRLAREGIIESQRGARGGYRLTRRADEITVAEVIAALEGPIGVTECASDETAGLCEFEGSCDMQPNWQRINDAVQTALEGITLADMLTPSRARLVTLGLKSPREDQAAQG